MTRELLSYLRARKRYWLALPMVLLAYCIP